MLHLGALRSGQGFPRPVVHHVDMSPAAGPGDGHVLNDAPVEVDLEVHHGSLRATLGMGPGDGRDTALIECPKIAPSWKTRPIPTGLSAREKASS